MLKQPQFKPHFHIESIPPKGIILFSENQTSLVKGELYLRLVDLIDGERTSQQISESLSDQFSAIEVCYGLISLEKQGYIVESESCPSDLTSAYWYALGQHPDQVRDKLQSARVAIKCFGSDRSLPILTEWRESLRLTLEDQQISISDEGEFEVVITDDYLREELEVYNQQALGNQKSWMLINPLGLRLFLGPIFVPGETGCWQCLAFRYQRNQPVRSFIETQNNCKIIPINIASPSSLKLALGVATELITQWLVQDSEHPLLGTLKTMETRSLISGDHTLVKRPQCSACGDPTLQAQRMLQPISLESCKKTAIEDGGYRCQDPQETLNQYQHHISPILGVIRELERYTPAHEKLVHNYRAPHWFAHDQMDSTALIESLHTSRSGGKGRTSTQAQASGCCEAIERYSGSFHGDELCKQARFCDLGDLAIHPNHCMLFSDTQYQQRTEWNVHCDRPQRVPEPFDPEQEISWSPLFSLTHQSIKYLPTAYCFYGFSEKDQDFCYADSNGCAAGNTREEAIIQGFMELAERDCAAIWWYNRIQRPQVDLASFSDPYFVELKQFYDSCGRDIWVIDITHDLGIPTFVAVSNKKGCSSEPIIFGFGAHFSARIAISRALTEANQMRDALQAAPGGRASFLPYGWEQRHIDELFYMYPDDTAAPRKAQDFRDRSSQNTEDDVKLCQSIVEAHGMEMLVLDQTRPDIGLPVVKVVVPGLRHFWKRWAPGRLYDVPKAQGWIPQIKTEDQLNPTPVFF